MGYGSAGYTIFDPMARALIKAGTPDEEKEQVLGDLIKRLQDEDWDTELDSLQEFRDDPAIVRAFAKNGITWPDEDDGLTDSDSAILGLISEIASRLEDATDDGEYQAVGLIGDLANGRKTVEDARTELADITFRHV
jgi:hypothetical protein